MPQRYHRLSREELHIVRDALRELRRAKDDPPEVLEQAVAAATVLERRRIAQAFEKASDLEAAALLARLRRGDGV